MLSKSVIVDKELIEAGKSPRGGWTAEQISILGAKWKWRAQAGWWIKESLGKTITPAQAKQFIALRGQCKDAKSRWKNVAKELRLDSQKKKLVEQLTERIKFAIAAWPKPVLKLLAADEDFAEEIEQIARQQIAQRKRGNLLPIDAR